MQNLPYSLLQLHFEMDEVRKCAKYLRGNSLDGREAEVRWAIVPRHGLNPAAELDPVPRPTYELRLGKMKVISSSPELIVSTFVALSM